MNRIYKTLSTIVIINQFLDLGIVLVNAHKGQNEQCPTMCICDIHRELNTANCRWVFLCQEFIHFFAIFFFSNSIIHFVNMANPGTKKKHWNSNEHLISAFIGISSFVELLDLSSNDITIIDNQCFHVSDEISKHEM